MPAELQEVVQQAQARWTGRIEVNLDGSDGTSWLMQCEPSEVPEICKWLFSDLQQSFGGLIVEQRAGWEVRYIFYGSGVGWVQVVTYLSGGEVRVPSISRQVHAADWHEREAEDLFGLVFEGHPRLGDFVLHNDVWQEAVAPMRKTFDGRQPVAHRVPDSSWKPRRIVEESGAFAMPVGPVYSAATAPVYFQLETVGEDVIRAQPRLFYTYRGLEKIAEGRRADDVLLIAERISGTSAFAHSLAFCQSVERICQLEVPSRASSLRVFLAELERLRHHVAAIAGICESTGFAVAAAHAAILEEDLLRISCALTGHRYLFGLNVFGGLSIDFDDAACTRAAAAVSRVAAELTVLQDMLSTSSSFLDRLEEVGIVSLPNVRDFGLVGPIARASGLPHDLRKAQPYSGYEAIDFEVPQESEGDGYARLRLLFREAGQSGRILSAIARALPGGPFRNPAADLRPGAALGWVEAPGGAALHWIRLGVEGRVERYRVITPSFVNWHGFRLAAESFAFQDFPIILATFALSVHENDR
jgi:formate hydrogenlyase subunit 5